MKQGEITITSSGSVKVELSADGTVWATAYDIASLFHIRQGVAETHLRALLKANPIWVSSFMKEVIEPINGKECRVELFNLEVIIALSFRIDSYVCSIFRQWCVKQIIANQTKKPEMFIQLGGSTILN